MDYKELISDLRKEAEWYGMTEGGHAILLERAIMAITELLNQTEKAERERDVAVNQLRGDCEKCVHFKVTWKVAHRILSDRFQTDVLTGIYGNGTADRRRNKRGKN